jgi:hypothetical protein
MYVAAEGTKQKSKSKNLEEYDALIRVAQDTFPHLRDHVKNLRLFAHYLFAWGLLPWH